MSKFQPPPAVKKSKMTKHKCEKSSSTKAKSPQSDFVTVQNMTGKLFNSSLFLLTLLGPLTPNRCQFIIKALIIFVAHNPPSVAANLFKADQLSKINPWDVQSLESHKRRERNWQYVFSLINHYMVRNYACWVHQHELILMACQKSAAFTLGEMMAGHEESSKCDNMSVAIFGYWIAKLYSVSIYRSDPKDLPEPIRNAYFMFIRLNGEEWASKVPMLKFGDALWEREDIMACFPFALELPATAVPDDGGMIELGALDKEEHVKIYEFCTALGEDRLRTYISTFKGSLIDFYLKVFEMSPPHTLPPPGMLSFLSKLRELAAALAKGKQPLGQQVLRILGSSAMSKVKIPNANNNYSKPKPKAFVLEEKVLTQIGGNKNKVMEELKNFFSDLQNIQPSTLQSFAGFNPSQNLMR